MADTELNKVKGMGRLENVNFRLPKNLKEALQEYAEKNGKNVSMVLRELIMREIVAPQLPSQSKMWSELRAYIKESREVFSNLRSEMKELEKRISQIQDLLKSKV